MTMLQISLWLRQSLLSFSKEKGSERKSLKPIPHDPSLEAVKEEKDIGKPTRKSNQVAEDTLEAFDKGQK
jgi:hypothetical protein